MADVDYVYVDDDRDVQKAVDHLLTHDRLGYDTETTGLNLIGGFSKILLMQLGTEEITYLFDVRKIDTEPLREVLESESILKILHNAKFDYQATKLGTGIVLRNVFDTMLAYRLLTSGLIEDGKGGFVVAGFRDKNRKHFPYKSLNFLTQRYLGITLDKEVRKSFVDHQYHKKFTPRQLQYAAEDIAVLHPLCDLLGQELLDEDLIDTAILEFQFVRPVAEMEMNGVFLNQEKWRAIIGEAQKQADTFTKEMATILAPLSEQNTLFGESVINIKSPDQLMAAFRRLGVELENTDEKALKKIAHPNAQPLAKLILEYRAYNKLISTYGEALLRKINRATNRLHVTFHQLGADTGRLSSENPNIQNIPQDRENQDVKISFRDCFEAEPGNVILTADYSQCIPEDEWVCAQYGLRQMGRMNKKSLCVPGLNSRGTVPVESYIPKGEKEVVKITTTDGFQVSATADHKIHTDSGWKKAIDLNGYDRLVLARDWLEYNPRLSKEAVDFCEMLGYWSGDGSFTSGGVQFAQTEKKYYDVFYRLSSIAKKCFGKELKDYESTESWDLIGKPIQAEFERWGAERRLAVEKHVPDLVLQSGRGGISSYLRGLFEADGWVTATDKNIVVAFSTRSETLSRQVQMLLLGLGIFSKRKGYEETTTLRGREYTGTQFRVSICDEFNLSLFERQVGFISRVKRETLAARRRDRVRSDSDVVVMAEEEMLTLRQIAEKSNWWPEMRREFFANYYNHTQGKIRDYTRSKLVNLFTKYLLETPGFAFEHKASSAVERIESAGQRRVADLSVPEQKAFSVGTVFVHNCELRILAEKSQDAKFLEIFRNDQDLHIITSQEVFGYSDADLATYQEVKKKDGPDVDLFQFFDEEKVATYKKVADFRNKTKTINFGIVYGLSAWSLATRFKIPQEEAEDILNSYFQTYSGIKRWLNYNSYETIANRYARTILGRKKYFALADPEDEEKFRRSKSATRRMGNNHVIQGTNADITKEALVRLQEAYDDIPGAKLLFTVHDEIVSEAPKEVADRVAEVKAEIMKQAFHRFVKTVPVGKGDKVSVSRAKHWSK